MASPTNNLFLRLHKWATRQDENFLTETLAVVVEQLLVLVPAAGSELVGRLTGGFLDLPADHASAIEVATQVESGSGRPDLELRCPGRLVWIEVKVESPLRAGQLEGYRVLLAESGIERTRLVLLTRHPESIPHSGTRPDIELRWFEVADWLEAVHPTAAAGSEVAGFLVRQFLDFLEARGMTLAQVGKYMPEGLRALSNLTNMLDEAAVACKVRTERRWDKERIGLKLKPDGFWVGAEFSEPETLWFSTWDRQIDASAANHPGIGEVLLSESRGGGSYWCHKLALDSEEVHFFSRSKVSQMECLEGFLRECLQRARQVVAPGLQTAEGSEK